MQKETTMSIPDKIEKQPKTGAVQITFDAEIPEATEKVNKKGWVEYGDNNLYPQWLFTLAKDSPVHGGIVNQKTRFVAGNGVKVVGPLAAQSEAILKNGDSKYTINEVLDSVTHDNEVQSYLYYHFKRNVLGDGWNVSPLSSELMRPSEDLQTFYYSENWNKKKRQGPKTGYKEYKSYFNVIREPIGTPGEEGYIPADDECVMYIKKPAKQTLLEDGETLTTATFPTPAYSGCIPSIMAGVEMNYFDYAEVVNGFTSNTLVNLNNGEPEDEKEKEEIVASIGRQTGDRKKSGGVTVMFNDGVEKATTVEQLGSNDNATRYILAKEAISDQTMIGHSVQTPELFGVLSTGKLGGTVDLPLSFERFQHTYSEPQRKFIIDPLTEALAFLNDWDGLEFEYLDYSPPLQEDTESENPIINAINEMPDVLKPVFIGELSSEEIRSIGGLGPLPEGQTAVGAEPTGTPQQMAFKLEESIISKFQDIGTSRKDITVISSRAFDLKTSDAEYVAEFTAAKFAIELSVDQQRILQMIAKGESFKAIVDATDLSASQVGRQIITLTTEGLVAQATDGNPWSLTEEGNNSVATEELIDVRYTYERRVDATGPDKLPDGRTRSFCAALIDLNRAYTREEIDAISAAVDRDVWLFRGGWWNDDGVNKPSCRHFWKQNIILR